MLNRPRRSHSTAATPSTDGRSGDTERRPALRLVWLWVAMSLPLVAVLVRLAHLQGGMSDEFVRAFDVTTETAEAIPARDGRILSSDGRVLAYDVEQFELRAHYRWLEEPPDEDWLMQLATSGLTREERRDSERVREEQGRVLERRAAMWQRLSDLTGRAPDELAAQRIAIQTRIARMIDAVHERREIKEHGAAGEHDGSAGGSPSDQPWWQRAWRTVATELTTPPTRERRDPLVLREELEYHPLPGEIDLAMAAEIEAHPELYPGLQVATTTRRVYPESTLAAHLVGNRLPLTAEDVEQRDGRFSGGDPLDYRPGDRSGRTGVERRYDRELHGVRGLRTVVRNRRGEVIARHVEREPQTGRDVVLTLNATLQSRLEAYLDQVLMETASAGGNSPANGSATAGASIVVLDVHTGAVVAAISAPRYDLRLLADGDGDGWQRVLEDPRRPLLHRAIQMSVPPGSVFKTLSAVALLESGQIDPDEKLACRGYYLDNPNKNRCYIYSHYGIGHGETDLTDALARSCNVYFFAAADQIGPAPLVDWAARFGFGQPTGVDVPGESAGNLPRPPAGRAGNGAKQTPWYPGDTRGIAIGQSRLTVTPVQIARLMAVVANGGYPVVPHVVKGVTAPGEPFRPAGGLEAEGHAVPRERIDGLAEGTLERVREGLEQVVASPHGTGYKTVRLKEVSIAGKTGTAEVGVGKRDHAWFAGYVPADRPRYAFAVVLEHAGGGGSVAGPVARRLVQHMLNQGLISPSGLPAAPVAPITASARMP